MSDVIDSQQASGEAGHVPASVGMVGASNTYFSEPRLLLPPTERAAFSDRQAYVCAELSKLAYFKFEGGSSLDQAIGAARAILGDDARLAPLIEQLRVILGAAPSDASQGHAALRNILAEAAFDLVKTFTQQGTQAFLCTRKISLESGSSKTVAFLVFRGTEPKDFHDIKADISATLISAEVGGEAVEMHCGYLGAFELVKSDIKATLQGLTYDQLFLTGHSLGGALAVVATCLLAEDDTGACYTFGAPPVGTENVPNKVKTPIYQIVNETDIVPRLPNPWMTGAVLVLLRLFRLVAKIFTVIERVLASGNWDERLEAFIQSMTKYRHPGYVSYLVGSGQHARLRYNVSSFDRLKWWLAMMRKRGFSRFGKMVTDHSIDLYVEKLRVHALSRQ